MINASERKRDWTIYFQLLFYEEKTSKVANKMLKLLPHFQLRMFTGVWPHIGCC